MIFQVALAQMEYQLPRLTKMWTHLERQAGGQVKGMGEKQIEVDKRILRTQVSTSQLPYVFLSLVGYTLSENCCNCYFIIYTSHCLFSDMQLFLWINILL